MDVEKFIEVTKPKGRKTRLEPFAAPIRQLKQAGYTNQQIQHWLSLNGITVSVERVRQYANRLSGEDRPNQPPDSGKGEKGDSAIKKTSSIEDSRKKAEQYITPQAMNPILRKTLAEQHNQPQEKEDDSNSN